MPGPGPPCSLSQPYLSTQRFNSRPQPPPPRWHSGKWGAGGENRRFPFRRLSKRGPLKGTPESSSIMIPQMTTNLDRSTSTPNKQKTNRQNKRPLKFLIDKLPPSLLSAFLYSCHKWTLLGMVTIKLKLSEKPSRNRPLHVPLGRIL